MSAPAWFILYGGYSSDGMGRGTFVGRTTNLADAYRHYMGCTTSPYSTGYVDIVTDNAIERADVFTDWAKFASPSKEGAK